MPQNAEFCAGCGTTMQQTPPQYQQQPQYQQPVHQHYQQPTPNQYQQHVQPQYQQPQPMHGARNNYDTPQVRALIGKNADYYIRKFNAIENKGSNSSWNWAAFLFGYLWLAYRRTNSWHFWLSWSIGMVSLTLSAISLVLWLPISFDVFILILTAPIYIVIGVLGNSAYKKYIDDIIRTFHQH